LLEQALVIRQKLVQAEPRNIAYQADLAATHFALADLHQQANRPAEATDSHRQGLEALEAAYRDDPQHVVVKAYLPQLWLARAGRHAERKHWDEAAADFVRALELLPVAQFPWNLDPARFYEALVSYDEIFTRVTKLRPRDRQLWIARFNWNLRRSDWQVAASALAHVIELDPSDHIGWFHQAPLLLQLDDSEGYRRVCREMATRFGQTQDPNLAEPLVKTCCLAPGGVDDPKPLAELAERSLVNARGSGLVGWVQLANGTLDYRVRDYAAAVEQLGAIPPSNGATLNNLLEGMAKLYLAMAYHQLEKPAEARAALAKARSLVAEKYPSIDHAALISHWSQMEWLRFQVVRREAEGLIEGKQAVFRK
jgi:tetratricopeptide (TPR) repeat protein